MNVGAGGRADPGGRERLKGQLALSQILDNGLAFSSLWVKRKIDSISMIKAEIVVGRSLAEGTDG